MVTLYDQKKKIKKPPRKRDGFKRFDFSFDYLFTGVGSKRSTSPGKLSLVLISICG